MPDPFPLASPQIVLPRLSGLPVARSVAAAVAPAALHAPCLFRSACSNLHILVQNLTFCQMYCVMCIWQPCIVTAESARCELMLCDEAHVSHDQNHFAMFLMLSPAHAQFRSSLCQSSSSYKWKQLHQFRGFSSDESLHTWTASLLHAPRQAEGRYWRPPLPPEADAPRLLAFRFVPAHNNAHLVPTGMLGCCDRPVDASSPLVLLSS